MTGGYLIFLYDSVQGNVLTASSIYDKKPTSHIDEEILK